MEENNSEETNTTVINHTWDNSINEVETINNSGDVINEVVELNNDTSDHYDDSNMNEELIWTFEDDIEENIDNNEVNDNYVKSNNE